MMDKYQLFSLISHGCFPASSKRYNLFTKLQQRKLFDNLLKRRYDYRKDLKFSFCFSKMFSKVVGCGCIEMCLHAVIWERVKV